MPKQKKNKGKQTDSIISTVATISSFLGPALGIISTGVGYSWRVNVPGTMVSASAGGAITFMGNAFSFFGGNEDYRNLRNRFSESIMGIPKIEDSGVDSVTLIFSDEEISTGTQIEISVDQEYKQPSHDNKIDYYLHKNKGDITLTVKCNGQILMHNALGFDKLNKLEKLVLNTTISANDPGKEDTVIITGDNAFALINLIEASLTKEIGDFKHSIQHSVETFPDEDKTRCNIKGSFNSTMYLIQIIGFVFCLVQSIRYGKTAQADNNAVDTSSGYIDSSFPEAFIVSSLIAQLCATAINLALLSYQKVQTNSLTIEYDNKREEGDKRQGLANEKQKIKENMLRLNPIYEELDDIRTNLSVENLPIHAIFLNLNKIMSVLVKVKGLPGLSGEFLASVQLIISDVEQIQEEMQKEMADKNKGKEKEEIGENDNIKILQILNSAYIQLDKISNEMLKLRSGVSIEIEKEASEEQQRRSYCVLQ